jgi:hypothetical protein
MRHNVCVLGVEDLLDLSESVYLFANKMLPAKDMEAVLCWHELLWYRTHRDCGIGRLHKDIYLNLPQVRCCGVFCKLLDFRSGTIESGKDGVRSLMSGSLIVPQSWITIRFNKCVSVG